MLGLVTGELDQVTAIQEFGQACFLRLVQEWAPFQLRQKFLGRTLRRAKFKPFLEINPDGVGDLDTKRARAVNEAQSLLKPLPGAFVRGDDLARCLGRCLLFAPTPPGPISESARSEPPPASTRASAIRSGSEPAA